jgi:DNA repair protein RadC
MHTRGGQIMAEGHRKRLREKFLKVGINGLTTEEVLENLLTYCIPRKDTAEIARTLLNRFGSIKKILHADYEQLLNIPGLGPTSLDTLYFLLQFITKYDFKQEIARYFKTTHDKGCFLIAKYGLIKHEQLIAMYFDKDERLIDDIVICSGDLKYVPIDIPRIKKEYRKCNADHVVLAHNHPSGLALPSTLDMINTARMMIDFKKDRLNLSDHIIFEAGDFVSLTDSDVFQKYLAMMT